MPVNIDDAKEKVEKASGFFDTVNSFIKRHPLWAIGIAIVALSELGYLGWLTTHEEEVEPVEEVYYNEADSLAIDSTSYIVE
jgi:hypothetical protein